jgi:MYXO-CTERM domain-containing protein
VILGPDRPGAGDAPPNLRRRFRSRLAALTSVQRDVVLYGMSAFFAAVTGVAVGIPLYRQWGQMAVGPYVVAALLCLWAAWRWPRRVGWRRQRSVRRLAFAVALVGATLVPLCLEVVWASEGNVAQHVQPEVLVVERAGARVAHGHDPYRVVDRNGHIVIHQSAEPTYELYYPYLPGMVIFGFSSGSSVVEAQLTDARIQFLLFTAVITLIALSRVRPRSDARVRALQALTVLPTAALPLSTGGDDMPVAALMLLGLVALQRRRPVLAGLALGAASSLKFTAWPLVVLAAWAAFDLGRRRAVGRYALGVIAVVVPVIVPVALRNPSAFVDNVIRFPLGLAGVSSPAASALPGHILIAIWPAIHRPYVVVAGAVGLIVLATHLRRHPPVGAGGVATLTGWVMTVAILLAPATRVGYVLYPANLFIWGWMLRRAEDPAVPMGRSAAGGDRAAGAPSPGQVTSESSKTSTEKGVVPVAVAGETTMPTSHW